MNCRTIPYFHFNIFLFTETINQILFQLTHFVMLKELKHCRTVEELVVTDSVRSKAKMFVRKYMAKFGPVYRRPPEEAD